LVQGKQWNTKVHVSASELPSYYCFEDSKIWINLKVNSSLKSQTWETIGSVEFFDDADQFHLDLVQNGSDIRVSPFDIAISNLGYRQTLQRTKAEAGIRRAMDECFPDCGANRSHSGCRLFDCGGVRCCWRCLACSPVEIVNGSRCQLCHFHSRPGPDFLACVPEEACYASLVSVSLKFD
jgi:hypothetical protein